MRSLKGLALSGQAWEYIRRETSNACPGVRISSKVIGASRKMLLTPFPFLLPFLTFFSQHPTLLVPHHRGLPWDVKFKSLGSVIGLVT